MSEFESLVVSPLLAMHLDQLLARSYEDIEAKEVLDSGNITGVKDLVLIVHYYADHPTDERAKSIPQHITELLLRNNNEAGVLTFWHLLQAVCKYSRPFSPFEAVILVLMKYDKVKLWLCVLRSLVNYIYLPPIHISTWLKAATGDVKQIVLELVTTNHDGILYFFSEELLRMYWTSSTINVAVYSKAREVNRIINKYRSYYDVEE